MFYSSFDGYIYRKKLMIYYNRSYLQQHSMLVSLSYKIRFLIFIEFGIPFYYNGYKYVHNITVTHSVIILTNDWKLLGLHNKNLILLHHSKKIIILKTIIIGIIKVIYKKFQICLVYKWCFCEKIYRNQKAIIRNEWVNVTCQYTYTMYYHIKYTILWYHCTRWHHMRASIITLILLLQITRWWQVLR